MTHSVKGGERLERQGFNLTKSEIERIDDYRFAHRFPTRTAAIRSLLQKGFDVTERAQSAPQVAG